MARTEKIENFENGRQCDGLADKGKNNSKGPEEIKKMPALRKGARLSWVLLQSGSDNRDRSRVVAQLKRERFGSLRSEAEGGQQFDKLATGKTRLARVRRNKKQAVFSRTDAEECKLRTQRRSGGRWDFQRYCGSKKNQTWSATMKFGGEKGRKQRPQLKTASRDEIEQKGAGAYTKLTLSKRPLIMGEAGVHEEGGEGKRGE